MNSLYILPDYFTWLTIPVVLFSVLFSIYIYRNTTPVFPVPLKYVLISLRSLGLILIALLIFHPQIISQKEVKVFPSATVWFDKSGSMDKNLTTEKENELKIKLNSLIPDSVVFQFKYFSQTAESEPVNSKSWRSRTNFSEVVSKTNSPYNLVVTDGVFNDYEWILSGSSKSWDALILGDTSKTTGFHLFPLIQPTITAYEGDDQKIYASVGYQGVLNDSVSVEFKVQQENKKVSVKAESEDGSKTVSSVFTVREAGEYEYEVIMNYKNKNEIRKGKLIVKKRIQTVVLVAAQSDPMIGFFKRQLSKIGKTEVVIMIDSEKENIRKISELPSQNSVYILINYPVRKSDFLEKLKSKSKTNPFLFISNEKVLNSEFSILPQNWEVLPVQLAGQNWLPEIQNSVSAENFWNGWNQNMIDEFPPFTTFMAAIPQEKTRLSAIKIEKQKMEMPSQLLLRENPKSLWLLYGNFDQWERWDAINNIIPTRISQSTINFMTWMMTPSDISPVKLNIQTDYAKSNLNLIVSLDDKLSRESDSLQVKLNWGKTESRDFTRQESGVLATQIPFPANEKTEYQLTILKNSTSVFTLNGVYTRPEETEESEVKKSSLEPLSDWIVSKNGNLFIGSTNEGTIKTRLHELAKTETEKKVYDSWKNSYLFIFIIALFSAEWFVRKRIGAL